MAAEEVLAFESRFGPAAARLACHAAFPLFLTPELINLIRINFLSDDPGPLSWLADADFLLSPLCVPLGEATYCVEPQVRELLLADLLNWYGSDEANRRLYALADFLLAYLDRTGLDRLRPDIVRSQRWIGWSILDPQRVVQDMTALLDPAGLPAGASGGFSRQVLVATMLEVVRDPLASRVAAPEFQHLVETSEFLGQYWYRGQAGSDAAGTTSANPLLAAVQKDLSGQSVEQPLSSIETHRGAVMAVAVSPDGRFFVSGSMDRTARVWHLASARPVGAPLEGHEAPVLAVAFTPDGRHVLSGSADGKVRLWDLASAQLLRTFEGQGAGIVGVAADSGGPHVISATSEGQVRVWDLQSGQLLLKFQFLGDGITSVAISPEGRQLVSGSRDGTVQFWDLSGRYYRLGRSREPVDAVAISRRGRYIVSGARYGTVQIWELPGKRLLRAHRGRVGADREPDIAVAVSPDGRLVIASSADSTVRVWDLHGGQLLGTLEGHGALVLALAFTPDGRHVVSGRYDHTVRVWDLDRELASPAAPELDGARMIYDGGNSEAASTDLGRARLARAEGDPPTGDRAVDQAYDALGVTRDFLRDVLGRNSLDGRGMEMTAVVHYGKSSNNSFSLDEAIFLGDGDGVLFVSFSGSLDVIAHQLFHIVLRHETKLEYEGQPGALVESICDVFGVLVKQYALNQLAHDADWLVGADLLVSGVNGVAIRSLKAPGTAFDDPKLGGRDRQPWHMKDYMSLREDNGGVHTNNGIPNHAFFLTATALGGLAWEAAGQIWYEAILSEKLGARPTFSSFAALTIATAERLYARDSREVRAVRDGWQSVGVAGSEKAPLGPRSGRRRSRKAR
jgi:hypothetical protein